MEPKQQQQQQQQQPPPPQYPPPQAMAPVTYPAMTPTNKPPTFRRIIVRHTLFKAGVGGLFLSTLLFIVGYSAPAWANQDGLWLSCGYSCTSNTGAGPGESVSSIVRTYQYPRSFPQLGVADAEMMVHSMLTTQSFQRFSL